MMKKVATMFPLIFAGAMLCAPALADSDKQDGIERGAAHYRIFCINCHGDNADGNGPLVKLLKIKPADLTTLKKNSNGELSISEMVFRAVDGRHEVGEAQERKMPVFSQNLAIKSVIEIADFIEAIQK